MVSPIPPLRQAQTEAILKIVARGECCAIYGLSNTGKSPLLRALPAQAARYQQLAGRPGVLVYVDCNRVVELTPPGFYEIVLRSLLESLEDGLTPEALHKHLHDQHNRIITAASPFQASLAFNHALAQCCHDLGRDLALLFDEFDEVYAALESRTLLNLRALNDKFQRELALVTATVRPLAELRPQGEDEFAELFATNSMQLGLLSEADSRQVVDSTGGAALPADTRAALLRLAAGHFGLLTVLTQAALRNPDPAHLAYDPGARAECLKIWNQLRSPEQAALVSLVTEAESGLNPHMREQLRGLGLLTADAQIFSELFVLFVRRQSAQPQQAAGIVVDEDAGEVWVDGVKVTVLTDLEYKLMRLLAQRRDRLTTKDMIVEAVWGNAYFDTMDDARIEKLVSRLRAKIEPDPARPRYLLTQRGRGYKLSSQPVYSKDDDT
jgi:DNA-binding winged helix-turn-helix (wHTH) protein